MAERVERAVGDAAIVRLIGFERARRVLGSLPERYRRILELRFLQAMSLKEAAREMDVTVGNAKVLQHRALRLAAQAPEEGS